MYIYHDIWYGVASVSRIEVIIGLLCKRALLKRRYSAPKTYNFIDPTDRSHPIVAGVMRVHVHISLCQYPYPYLCISTSIYFYIYLYTHIRVWCYFPQTSAWECQAEWKVHWLKYTRLTIRAWIHTYTQEHSSPLEDISKETHHILAVLGSNLALKPVHLIHVDGFVVAAVQVEVFWV